jgi:uncharacterized protein (UPF0335 family)
MSFKHVVADTTPVNLHNHTQGALRAYVERIERLREEKTALVEDIREVYAEAQSSGFDAKAVRQIIRIRELPGDERHEYEDMLANFMRAHGMTQQQIAEALAVSRATV